jgi:PadR family transcriptional regulator AphA
MGSPRLLTATSYALLGLLDMRPWSSYELTKQMGRALHFVLPRAESNVYAESKRLVADGLASATHEATGRRTRTVYAITPAGRAALADWLSRSPRPTTLEAEGLLQLLFATTRTPDEIIGMLREIEAEAAAPQAPWIAVADEYLQDRGPFPERLHVNLLFWAFAARYTRMRIEWARWAQDVVAAWPASGRPDAETLKATLRAELEALERA